MTTREILYYPNHTLNKVCVPVETFDETAVALSGDLQETAKAHKAEGLAASQIGELVRVFVIRDGEEYIACFNPQILETKAELVNSVEGCLSFPGVNELVKRAESIRVSYQTESGETQERWLSGVSAVAFQHELDHLNGVLFTAHMGKLQKRMALKKLEKIKRRTKHQMENIQKMLSNAQHT